MSPDVSSSIFRLTALDSSLIFLTVSDNPDITDDCAPALILFSKLLDLDLKGTSITMHGIRRLCSAIDTEERDTYLHAPDKCYAYLDDLVSYYAVSIPPQYPMVDHPDQCPTLTRGSLEKNLSLHASFNSSIVTRGTRDVLIKSLQGILRTRMEDKQAEKVLYYPRRFVPKFPFQE
ncbi:hypothetical protein FRC03_007729 [Tulasnella sp. 419]|nr:hypothetical protein FRC03_007729 [Tulasnella sp. 419]